MATGGAGRHNKDGRDHGDHGDHSDARDANGTDDAPVHNQPVVHACKLLHMSRPCAQQSVQAHVHNVWFNFASQVHDSVVRTTNARNAARNAHNATDARNAHNATDARNGELPSLSPNVTVVPTTV